MDDAASPSLVERIDRRVMRTDPDEILVVFDSTVPGIDPAWSKERKIEAVRTHRKAESAASQKALLAWLEQKQRERPELYYRAFWITNMVHVRGPLPPLDEFTAQVVDGPDASRYRILQNDRTRIFRPPEDDRYEVFTDTERARPWHVDHLLGADKILGLTGRGVLVGVIDTGVRVSHASIKDNFAENGWHDATSEARSRPFHGDGDHGTKAVGQVLGYECLDDQQNPQRIALATGAAWVTCRAFIEDEGTLASVAGCLEWMLERDAVPDIVNLSASFEPTETSETTIPPWVEALEAAGIVFVVSTGNPRNGTRYGSIIEYPARLGGPITVGGYYLDDGGQVRVDPQSGRGQRNQSPVKPDVVAPSGGIWSVTNANDLDCGPWGMTSAAAPQVSGVVALMMERCPTLRGRPDQVRRLLRYSADPTTDGCEPPGPMPHPDFGYGVPRPSCLLARLDAGLCER